MSYILLKAMKSQLLENFLVTLREIRNIDKECSFRKKISSSIAFKQVEGTNKLVLRLSSSENVRFDPKLTQSSLTESSSECL